MKLGVKQIGKQETNGSNVNRSIVNELRYNSTILRDMEETWKGDVRHMEETCKRNK